MSLFEEANKLGDEVRAKRDAQKAAEKVAKEAAEKAKADALKEQKEHEENKRQGKIEL